jgi:hypothetical protein
VLPLLHLVLLLLLPPPPAAQHEGRVGMAARLHRWHQNNNSLGNSPGMVLFDISLSILSMSN